MSEILGTWIRIPWGINESSNELTVVPKWYKPYIDTAKNGTEWMKTIIQANYPAITHIQIFHESNADIGWNMLVKLIYNGKNIWFPVSWDRRISTLTPTRFENLAPHIQSMNPETRWLFNVILQEISKIESIQWKTKTALAGLEEETTTA